MRRVIPAILLAAFTAIGLSAPRASALTITDPASVSGTALIYGYDGIPRALAKANVKPAKSSPPTRLQNVSPCVSRTCSPSL